MSKHNHIDPDMYWGYCEACWERGVAIYGTCMLCGKLIWSKEHVRYISDNLILHEDCYQEHIHKNEV